MDRQELTRQVSAELGDRQLIWFGTRGNDVASVADLPQFAGAFSVISAYDRGSAVESCALEDLTGRRVDLDAHDIDDETDGDAVSELRRAMLRITSRPSWVFTYRPSNFVSTVCFARNDRTTYLGMFKSHQAAFEHKPWVESGVAELGIPRIPWRYIVDDERLGALELLADGPIVLRTSRGSGGTGLTLVEHEDELHAAWPFDATSFVSVAPFVSDGIPVNVSGVVWRDTVTVGLPSVQLIGVPELTARPFGYCGNDFGAIKQFEDRVIDLIEDYTKVVGKWLAARGYLGAYGVDFLVKDAEPLFTEVNPRFQGSTRLSSLLSTLGGKSCVVLEHLAANLGISPKAEEPLRTRVARAEDLAQMVVHSLSPQSAAVSALPLVDRCATVPGFRHADVMTHDDLVTEPGATVARILVSGGLTNGGFDVLEQWRAPVEEFQRSPSDAGQVSMDPVR